METRAFAMIETDKDVKQEVCIYLSYVRPTTLRNQISERRCPPLADKGVLEKRGRGPVLCRAMRMEEGAPRTAQPLYSVYGAHSTLSEGLVLSPVVGIGHWPARGPTSTQAHIPIPDCRGFHNKAGF